MLRSLQQRDMRMKILLWVIVIAIGGAMVITLAPGPVGSLDERPDLVANVAGAPVTTVHVQNQLARIDRRQPIPPALRPFYTRQILDQLMFERMLAYEAKRLGIRVTEEEQVERIKLLAPGAFDGTTFAGRDRYAFELEQRFGLTVSEFEEALRSALLEEKFRRLVTDGISVTAGEVEMEYRRRNEQVKFDYAVADPAELEARLRPTEDDLRAYYQAALARYQWPERRAVRFVHLDVEQVRQRTVPAEDELRAYYDAHVENYRLQNRARVSHILFRTTGKTDAEIEEVRATARGILERLRRGARFEDMAREHSEDPANKEQGGNLGWIYPGQTVPAFEQAAFSLPVNTLSDLVETNYGFHILRVAEREPARTQPFEEVRATILPAVSAEKAEAEVNRLSDQLMAAARQSTRRPLEEIARPFNLPVRESGLLAQTDPVPGLGMPPGLSEEIFRLREGELSPVMRTEQGYALLALKEVQPARQGTFEEMRGRVDGDYRREKGLEQARTRAQQLASRAKEEPFAQVARSLGLEVKSSESLSRTGSIPALGSVRQFAEAFTLPVNGVSSALQVGGRWVVLRVTSRVEADMAGLEAERQGLEAQLLGSKQGLAYSAFREGLEARMRQEGQLRINAEMVARLTATQ